MPDLTISTHSHLLQSDNTSTNTIDLDFEQTIITHIVGNYFENKSFPLFLAIQGSMGEGKTFQTLKSCQKNGISTYYYSGSELCGAYEKDSISAFSEEYKIANFKYETEKCLSVFIIDDFHLSIASVKQSTGITVNSQILIGYLMNLADSTKVKPFSIPVILLANNFKNLYAPLTRDGRMDFYTWHPTLEQKISIITNMFEDFAHVVSVKPSFWGRRTVCKDNSESIKSWVTKYQSQPGEK